MLVYIVLALVTGLCAFFETGTRSKSTIRSFYICLTLFFLVVGLRYMHGDYGTYKTGYDYDFDVGGDEGYFQLQLFARSLGLSFEAFIFLITFFSVLCLRQIFSLSLWPVFGLTFILGKIFTMYAMSGIRQYLAMVLCWWALSELLKNQRRVLFIVMVLIAYTLHGSAIVFLPILFFSKRTFSYKFAFLIILLSVIVGYSMISIYGAAAEVSDLIKDRFGSYVRGRSEESMNLLNYAENLLFLVLAIKVRKKAVERIPYYDVFLYMFIIYCGFLIAGSEVGVVKRLRDYYAISYAFIIPAFIYLFENKSLKVLSRGVLISYFIFLMFRSLFVFDAAFEEGRYHRMIPYHSIFQMKPL